MESPWSTPDSEILRRLCSGCEKPTRRDRTGWCGSGGTRAGSLFEQIRNLPSWKARWSPGNLAVSEVSVESGKLSNDGEWVSPGETVLCRSPRNVWDTLLSEGQL